MEVDLRKHVHFAETLTAHPRQDDFTYGTSSMMTANPSTSPDMPLLSVPHIDRASYGKSLFGDPFITESFAPSNSLYNMSSGNSLDSAHQPNPQSPFPDAPRAESAYPADFPQYNLQLAPLDLSFMNNGNYGR